MPPAPAGGTKNALLPGSPPRPVSSPLSAGGVRVTLEAKPHPDDTNPAPNATNPPVIILPPAVSLPVLPLKNTVLFPHLFLPLAVGRPNSVAAVEAALGNEEKTLVVVAQRDGEDDRVTADNLFAVGTRAVIKKMNRSAEALEFLVQGLERVSIEEVEQVDPYLK